MNPAPPVTRAFIGRASYGRALRCRPQAHGRRRIGNTELILQFAEAERCLYFEATIGAAAQRHLAGTVMPRLDAFVSAPAFEQICQARLARQLDASEKALLRRLAPHLGHSDGEPDVYFFSRSGFEPALVHEAKADPKCHLIDVDELFRAS